VHNLFGLLIINVALPFNTKPYDTNCTDIFRAVKQHYGTNTGDAWTADLTRHGYNAVLSCPYTRNRRIRLHANPLRSALRRRMKRHTKNKKRIDCITLQAC